MKRFPIVSPSTKITKHHQTPKGSPSFSFVRLASTGRTVVMGGESAPRSDLSLCSLAIKQGKCHGDSNLHQFPMLWRSFLGWILKFRTVIGAAEKAPWTYWPMRFDRMELGLTNPTDWKKHWSWPKWKQRRRREEWDCNIIFVPGLLHSLGHSTKNGRSDGTLWQVIGCQYDFNTETMHPIIFCTTGTWGADCTSVTLTPAGSIIFAICMPVACFYQVYNLICSSQNHISNQVLVLKNVFATECTKSETQSWLWTCLRWHLRWQLMTIDDNWWHVHYICTTFVLHVLWQTAWRNLRRRDRPNAPLARGDLLGQSCGGGGTRWSNMRYERNWTYCNSIYYIYY